jgi:pyridoxal phosphate enzyme (YggS family)
MTSIQTRLETIHRRIAQAAAQYNCPAESIQLLAVSKTRPAEDIREALAAGQRHFGESYLQEALEKIQALADTQAHWHFIGRIQSNKTRSIAENFEWVHSLYSVKHAQRLNSQRPDELPPLKVCLQINLGGEETKGGIRPEEATELIARIRELPRLSLQGLMTLPPPEEEFDKQRLPFRTLRELRDQLANSELPLATLSMGMSDDLEAAIAEGATIVRIGTAIFGPRNYAATKA